MAHEFETLNQAASALLIETCALLNERQLGYVVAGGWVPVLRSTGSDLLERATLMCFSTTIAQPYEVLSNACSKMVSSCPQNMSSNYCVPSVWPLENLYLT
jgi:hypothetical protein